MSESIKKYIKDRINYADSKIKLWEGDKEIQRVWIAVKAELESLQRKMIKEGW